MLKEINTAERKDFVTKPVAETGYLTQGLHVIAGALIFFKFNFVAHEFVNKPLCS